MPVKNTFAAGAMALGLMFTVAACEDNSSEDTEDISPEIDDGGGEDGVNTDDVSPELDEGTGEDGLTEDTMTEESGE